MAPVFQAGLVAKKRFKTETDEFEHEGRVVGRSKVNIKVEVEDQTSLPDLSVQNQREVVSKDHVKKTEAKTVTSGSGGSIVIKTEVEDKAVASSSQNVKQVSVMRSKSFSRTGGFKIRKEKTVMEAEYVGEGLKEIIVNPEDGGEVLDATVHDDVEQVDRLLSEGAADMNGFGCEESLLHLAAWYGSTKVCRLLLNRGAPTNVFNKHRCTPLHFAAHNGHTQICRMLINWGTPTNVVDINNSTPLHLAAWNGHMEVCSLLLEWHTPVNIRDSYFATPLHVAVAAGKYRICAMLLEHGASVKLLDKDKRSPLQLARLKGYYRITSLLEQEAGYKFFV